VDRDKAAVGKSCVAMGVLEAKGEGREGDEEGGREGGRRGVPEADLLHLGG